VLDETIDREVARPARTGEPLTVVMVDIDHCTACNVNASNDGFDHPAGDVLLARFAERFTWFEAERAGRDRAHVTA
jgi:GGDEF domain-containing protein